MLTFFTGMAFGWLDIIYLIACALGLIASIAFYDRHSFGWSGFNLFLVVVFGTLLWTGGDLSVITRIHFTKETIEAILAYVVGYILIGLVVSVVNWIVYIWQVKNRYQTNVYDSMTNPGWKKRAISAITGKFFEYSDSKDYAPEAFGLSMKLAKLYNQLSVLKKNGADIYGSYEIAIAVDNGEQLDNGLDNVKTAYAAARAKADKGDASADQKAEMVVEQLYSTLDQLLQNVLPPKARYCRAMIISSAIEWPVVILWIFLHRLASVFYTKLFFSCQYFFNTISRLAFGSRHID